MQGEVRTKIYRIFDMTLLHVTQWLQWQVRGRFEGYFKASLRFRYSI